MSAKGTVTVNPSGDLVLCVNGEYNQFSNPDDLLIYAYNNKVDLKLPEGGICTTPSNMQKRSEKLS